MVRPKEIDVTNHIARALVQVQAVAKRKAASSRRIKVKIQRHIRQWSEEFGPIHLDLNLMPERSMSSWAKARLDRIAHKTHTSVQSILEVAAMCVLDYQQNHEDNEDSPKQREP